MEHYYECITGLHAIADDAASSMLDKEKGNKNETNDIGIQAFYVVSQLGVGYRLIALLLPFDVLGPSYMYASFTFVSSMF